MLFAEGSSIHVRLFIAVVASIALLMAEHISPHLDPVRAALSLLVDPIKYLVDLPSETANRISNSFSTNTTLKEDNKKLRNTQLLNQIRLLKFEALEQENIRLRALLENSFKLGEQVLVTELLSVNIVPPYENIVVVNKGTRFGVHTQQAVVDANGIVGQVFRALPNSSEIMLITDPNHAIPVQVNRNGLLTIAVGSGELNRLKLPFLPDNADVRPGDLLITSGLGGTFPQGYPVAVVDTFTPPVSKQITATPKALLDRNRELMIVWSDKEPVSFAPTQTPAQTGVEENTHE
ncbi:MAG: rod shape-determining protein MreC [Methyloglobulus sp.]|nr:rod shape-determining protein MreC [Methyloglobulus sp.]